MTIPETSWVDCTVADSEPIALAIDEWRHGESLLTNAELSTATYSVPVGYSPEPHPDYLTADRLRVRLASGVEWLIEIDYDADLIGGDMHGSTSYHVLACGGAS